jgi:diguanylate cyclase (GGDEF)-like protein
VTKGLLRLLPGAVLLAAAALALRSATLKSAVAPLVPTYPLVVLGGGILLGWRFDRARLVLTLTLLLLAERALAVWAPGPGGGDVARAVYGALAVLVPLDLAVLGWLPERGLFARPGRVAFVLLAVQVLLVAVLCQPLFLPLTAWVEGSRVAGVPHVSLIAFGIAAILLGLRALVQGTALESGMAWTVAASYLAFASGGGLPASLYLATGGLILVLSLIEMWHGMAYDDELTGLPARRALNEALGRLRGTYTVAMVDVDHFKRFNDEHGHDVGDQLLRMVGARLAAIGGGGRAFRYGGEEFAVLFQGKAVEQTRDHLEALCRMIEETPFTLRAPSRPAAKPDGPAAAGSRRRVAVTVSIGVAGSDGGAESADEVVRAADAALYRAKQGGRNQVRT